AGEDLVHEPHGALAPDCEGRQGVRKRHHLLEREHRQRAGDGLLGALADRLLDVRALDDLDARATVSLRAKARDVPSASLHPYSPVSIGTLRLVAARARSGSSTRRIPSS